MNGIGSNALTTGSFDPVSKQRVETRRSSGEKLSYDWNMVMMRRGMSCVNGKNSTLAGAF